MSPYSVLEPGSARRRAAQRRAQQRRRRRVAVFVLVLVVALLAVLLALLPGRTSGPGTIATKGHRTGSTPRSVQSPHAVIRPTYGSVLEPASEQLHLRQTFHLTSGILFDVWTGRVLWEHDPGVRLPIASLTKMMTALLVAEHTRPTDPVLITEAAVHFTGSGVGLLPLHKRVSVGTLLYGLLLPSGNDAAIALAQHVAGTERAFVAMMNRQARAMQLGCTHFATVSGIVDRDNYSCTTDLAVLAHAVLEQPLLSRIVASPNAVLPFPIKGGKLWLYNNNPLLLAGYPGTDGVKTGYTTAAGMCLVATARRGHTWLGVVLLHSINTGAQAEKLLNAGFALMARQ